MFCSTPSRGFLKISRRWNLWWCSRYKAARRASCHRGGFSCPRWTRWWGGGMKPATEEDPLIGRSRLTLWHELLRRQSMCLTPLQSSCSHLNVIYCSLFNMHPRPTTQNNSKPCCRRPIQTRLWLRSTKRWTSAVWSSSMACVHLQWQGPLCRCPTAAWRKWINRWVDGYISFTNYKYSRQQT